MVRATKPKPPTDEVVSSNKRTIKKVVREPSTWAGLLTVAAAFLTGGASALTDPVLLSQIGAGLSMIALKEASIQPEE